MSKKNTLTTGCGDWHLGWGFGGHDKLGKLELLPLSNTFMWRGYSQGRWGQKWNMGAFVNFTIDNSTGIDRIAVISQKGGYPETAELIKSANIILQQQMTK